MKKEKKKFKMTSKLRVLYETLVVLEEAKKIVSKPYGIFRRRVDTKALIEVFNLYAKAKADFWNDILKEYPELEGKDIMANFKEIIPKN